MENDLTIRKLQECIKNIDHKNNSNSKYMLKLMEEVGELAEVIRKNKRMEEGLTIKGTIEEELQDVLYYVICLANINNIDLQECIYLKEKLNCEKYNRKNMFDVSEYTLYLKEMNNINAKSYIGKTITVKIDRKMGSQHPKYGFIYPINYGYVPNTISGDGEELDGYILGVFEPIESFTGTCIAIIHRLNDNDDKLVLVPEDKKYTDDEIRALTEFQERFFKSTIIS